MIPGNRKFDRFNPKDNCKVRCWVLSGMSTSSDFDVNTVHHNDTNDAAENHIVENSRSKLDNGCLSHMKQLTVPRRDSQHICNTCCGKDMDKFGGFFRWPGTDVILPYPFEDITKTLDPPQPCSVHVDIIHLLDYTIKTVVLHL